MYAGSGSLLVQPGYTLAPLSTSGWRPRKVDQRLRLVTTSGLRGKSRSAPRSAVECAGNRGIGPFGGDLFCGKESKSESRETRMTCIRYPRGLVASGVVLVKRLFW